jgi:hypothetical protein
MLKEQAAHHGISATNVEYCSRGRKEGYHPLGVIAVTPFVSFEPPPVIRTSLTVLREFYTVHTIVSPKKTWVTTEL